MKSFRFRAASSRPLIGVCLGLVILVTSSPVQAAAKPSARVTDGICNKSEFNKVANDRGTGAQIRCTKVGTKYRWKLAAGPQSGFGTVTVNKTIYISGTRVEVQTVTIDGSAFRVAAKVINENVTDQAVLDQLSRTPVLIENSAGVRAELSISDVRSIPVGSFSPITWSGSQGNSLITTTDARLLFGSAQNNQSFVPLGLGAPTTFVPKVNFGRGSTIDTSVARVEVLETKLRATYRNEEKGQYALYARIKVTGKVFSAGGTYVGMNMFTLTLPSGNRALATYDGYSDGDPLNGVVNENVSITQWIMFLVSETAGPVSLEFKDGEVSGSTQFAIP
jgi:hypothetical protein